jgi:uncharacterized protein YkwD/uncharacterized membrane protein required for colicin V production
VTILVDLIIVAILVYAGYAGTKRGAIMLAFELGSFLIATTVALLAYHDLGGVLKGWLQISTAMGNVAAFAITWMVTEVICALGVRFFVLRHISHEIHLSLPNQIAGAVLGVVKYIFIIGLGLIVFAGLPLSASWKTPVLDAAFARVFLGSSSQIQARLSTGLGRDLGDSLNFFTVTNNEPSGHETTVQLGFKATGEPSDADEQQMLGLVNQERISHGLRTLTLNTKAREVARAHSQDMLQRGYFSHITPEGFSPFDRLKAGKVAFGSAGENLALAPTLALAHQGLMNSPPHRANILNPAYRTVGIGVLDAGPYGVMVTQNFTD